MTHEELCRALLVERFAHPTPEYRRPQPPTQVPKPSTAGKQGRTQAHLQMVRAARRTEVTDPTDDAEVAANAAPGDVRRSA